MIIRGGDLVAHMTGGVLEQVDVAAPIDVVAGTFYYEMAVKAEEMITEYGTNVIFNRFNQTFENDSKPWLGPADPRSLPDVTATVKAVFVPPSGASALGMRTVDEDLLKRTDEICIVAPGIDAPPFDLITANEVVRDSVNWKVQFVETLKPADIVLLYFVGVAR